MAAAQAADTAATALDQAVAGLPKPAVDEHRHAAPELRLIDLSLSVLGAAGASTASDEELEGLKAGGHDPGRRGFTFQAAELSLSGAVDPYFNAEAHLVAVPGAIELEEAYLTTTGLPYGLEAKAGYQLIEFGRVNASHAHSWAWIDQPVIATRLLGPDGSRAPGARIAWLAPASWYSQLTLGVFNADDESLASFRGAAGHSHDGHEDEAESTVGGRARSGEQAVRGLPDMLCLARWENAFALDSTEARLGLSWMGGPNASGDGRRSDLYAADLTIGWKPATAGAISFVKATAEVMLRRSAVPASAYDPDGTPSTGDEFTAPATTLVDWGGYAQILVGIHERWSAGLRGEYATARGDSVIEDHETESVALEDHGHDPLRDTRVRVSPLVQFHASEFSRLRLQYDYDRADSLADGHAHSVWLGVEVLIGAHPAHGF